MRAKDLILDFIHHLFLIGLICFVIIYFIAGDRFGAFVEVMRSLVPLSIFGIIFLIMLKFRRLELKGGGSDIRELGGPEIILYLKQFDRLKSDIVIFSLPIIILAIAILLGKQVTGVDIYQATVAFLIVYYWQKNLFNKGRS